MTQTSMMSTYFLRTQRLGFRQWSAIDLELAIALWGDADVTRLIGGPFSPPQVQERLAREMAYQNQYHVQYWPIFLLATGAHAGCCGVRPYRLEQKVYEIGFHLHKAYWGQGLAMEAARGVMDYAFNQLGIEGLFAGHNPANQASWRVLQKLGFTYTHDEFYPPTGLNHPSYLLTKSDYAA
jgi:RimJ/RimL family protein N-acetyltransferase